MRLMFYIFLYAFLDVTSVAVFGKKAVKKVPRTRRTNGFRIVDLVLDLLDRMTNTGSSGSGSNTNMTLIRELLSRQITTFSENMDKKFEELFEKLEELPQEFIFLLDRNYLKRKYKEIQSITEYQVLAQIRMNNRRRWVPDRPSSFESTWKDIRHMISEKKFFTSLSTNWEDYYHKQWEGVCHTNMSNAQVIYTLVGQYLNIAKQYYLARDIDLNIRKRNQEINGGKNDFEGADEDLYSDVQSEVNEDMKYFTNIMNEASREFWTCDKEIDSPSPWFVELKAFTKYFTVKKNIEVPCENGCSNFKITTCKSEDDNGLCSKLRFCPNELISCQPHRSVQLINFCSDNCDTETYRRYAFITHGLFGERKCNKNKTIANNSPSFDPFFNGQRKRTEKDIKDGAYFECVCREDQYVISTLPVEADPDHIIIGVRLVVLNKKIVIEAVQGQLDRAGYVENDRIKQPPIDNHDKKYLKKLKWNDTIDLTPTIVPENHVVTGLRFRKKDKRFYLQLQSQELNSNYQLVSKKQWNTKSNFGTEEYSFGAVYRPDNKTAKNNKNSRANQFVKFNVTGLYEDGGQTTIPFIDTQFIQPVPFIPLSGASLYVRGKAGFAGFLGIKLQTYNASSYFIEDANVKASVDEIQEELKRL